MENEFRTSQITVVRNCTKILILRLHLNFDFFHMSSHDKSPSKTICTKILDFPYMNTLKACWFQISCWLPEKILIKLRLGKIFLNITQKN